MVITADHGNVEQMFDAQTAQQHTAHTLNLVPLIVLAAAWENDHRPLPEGCLADIAPTLLALMELPQPTEMSGKSLLRKS